MKPRRENGATFVSPMTSDVRTGSALMMDFLRFNVGGAFSKRSRRNANHQPASSHPLDIGGRHSAGFGRTGGQKRGTKNKAVGAV
jgi:hypothetical protein